MKRNEFTKTCNRPAPTEGLPESPELERAVFGRFDSRTGSTARRGGNRRNFGIRRRKKRQNLRRDALDVGAWR